MQEKLLVTKLAIFIVVLAYISFKIFNFNVWFFGQEEDVVASPLCFWKSFPVATFAEKFEGITFCYWVMKRLLLTKDNGKSQRYFKCKIWNLLAAGKIWKNQLWNMLPWTLFSYFFRHVAGSNAVLFAVPGLEPKKFRAYLWQFIVTCWKLNNTPGFLLAAATLSYIFCSFLWK